MSFKSAIRIVTVDSYMSSPIQDLDVMYSDFRGSSINQVPIIRIFGSTDSGEKICLHIHGVFPYFYIPYDGNEDSNRLRYQIAANIDKALNVSFGQASATTQHVYKIVLVSGIPFYGYHTREHQFFKIYLYNPSLIRKVSNMLQSEVILGRLYQPHESHIPYILQFMIDYNLHGMSRILLNNLKYRNNCFGSIPQQSYCQLEADTLTENILNRLEIEDGKMGINPGIAALWEDEKQRLRNKSEESQIGPCLTLDNSQVEPTKSHKIFKRALSEKLCIFEDLNEKIENISVYPAESPQNTTFQNASFIEIHSSPSESSTNESVFNTTLDNYAQDLFDILQDLGRKNTENEEIDSILSQLPKEEDNDEENLDLSISIAESLKNEEGFDDLDVTVIPQLDGQDDEDDKNKKKQKSREESKYRSLPIFVSTFNGKSQESLKNEEGFDDLDITVIPQLDGQDDENDKSKKNQKSREESKYRSLPIFVSTFNGKSQDTINLQGSNRTKLNSQTDCLAEITTYEEKIECKYKPKSKSTAELYDIQENYKPKEGCSTVLTQSSDKSELKLSSESDIFASSEYNELKSPLISQDGSMITPLNKPPTVAEILENLETLKLPKVIHETPFYSEISDVTNSIEIGYSLLKIPSKTTAHLEEYQSLYNGLEIYRKKKFPSNLKWTNENIKKMKFSFCSPEICLITPVKLPPTSDEAEKWLKTKSTKTKKTQNEKLQKIYIPQSPDCDESDLELTLSMSQSENLHNSGQITGNFDNAFKTTPEDYQKAKAVNEIQNLTILSVEIHVNTRSDLRPDPNYDSIKAIFYRVCTDFDCCSGIITVDELKSSETNSELICVLTEEELLNELVKLVQKWDPDILVGYETEMLSWGYLLQRAQIINHNLLMLLSRIKDNSRSFSDDDGLKITGRILLNIWRLLRHEIALQSYTFENITYHLLHKRIPVFSFKNLTNFWNNPLFRNRTISHYSFRVSTVLEILEKLDLIGRTSELARLFGIQFYEVLSRGSQFRVESMMLRLAKPLNYIPVSPSVQQRAKMKAPEFLPLILEPESKFYVDPVIVLDFQSLYPSIIIAYNYCFSTCLGKVIHLGKNTPFEFGTTQLKISKNLINTFLKQDCINFSPCGVGFVKKQIRDGILPRMLREILDTRLMIKNSMKTNKDNKLLQKVLHNRQLGLKLIANVTYGYTSANFSGRMPAVEIGDSVVSKARETLQRAIELVEETTEWGARVVYGDTDSLFVLVPGKTRDEAFVIGQKIADSVTKSNPDPVKLKLEKIYQPCILQTKKRYVGYMYETPEQKEPIFLAKGIETVRRDGCPAVSKMLEKCLCLLFETKNVSLVKKYVLRQFDKILSGRISLQDLTFAKEYRGASGYRPGACVPALELAKKWSTVDPRSEPRRGERVPYIIANGPPGLPLIKLVKSPREFLLDQSLRPNAIYYITKVIIPPINRCFNLIGADLSKWFNQMPRKFIQTLRNTSPVKKSTISQYFVSNSCACCGQQTQNDLCEICRKMTQKTGVILHEKLRIWEDNYYSTNLICQTCTGIFYEFLCESLDCPNLYKINQASRDLEQANYIREVITSINT